MPTPSEPGQGVRNEEWAARSAAPPRSVFVNYPSAQPAGASVGRDPATPESPAPARAAAAPLQAAIDEAMARAFLYRFLAQSYEDPTPEAWARLGSCRRDLESAVRALAGTAPALLDSAAGLCARLASEGFGPFLDSYLAAFGHAARGRCPLNEIEYGDLKADPLFQPHRLADLTAFYRAFGLEVSDEAGERQDHLCLELEFMCVLAAKEAYALEQQLDPEYLSLCRDAQRDFLRAHLGRWTPAFSRRLARLAGETTLGALAELTRKFVEAECARCRVPAGSEDLLLRPVDEAAESLCHSCGLAQPPAAPEQYA